MRAYTLSPRSCSGCSASSSAGAARPAAGASRATLSHPGVAPTSLLAARTETGRGQDGAEIRLIRWLSRRGLFVGTPETAALPALLAATADAAPGDLRFFGPVGSRRDWAGARRSGGRGSPLRSEADARRVWDVSQQLAAVPLSAT